MNVLFITTPRRAGSWLAEAFASDSACQVTLEEAQGAAAGLARLREAAFDALLISHEPGQLDALELLDALRAGGGDEALVMLGQASEQEMAALCYEAGADAYLCVNTATTRTLLWVVARAAERRQLIRENRRLVQAQQHRLRQDHGETERLLNEQRSLIRDAEGLGDEAPEEELSTTAEAIEAIGRRAAGAAPPPPADEGLRAHYRELMRTHVIMGSGNLASEMATLAELLAGGGVTAPQTLQMHVEVLEELVRGLGSRSARHVMTRADLLVLEVLVHLAESYRRGERGGADDATGRRRTVANHA
jgi:DNA-binding NarL/FixJ family response regulator